MKKLYIGLLICCIASFAHGQNIAINETGAQPDTSAMLDVSSTTKGFLLPRMTKLQRNAIPLPGAGLMVYQTGPDSVGFHYFNGTKWLWLAAASTEKAWSTTGNSGTDTATHFLGTLDDEPMLLKQNNQWMGLLNTSNHSFFVGGGSGRMNANIGNTGFGDSTLNQNSSGFMNTAFGYNAMKGTGPMTGNSNTAIGGSALYSLSSGSLNIGVGNYALTKLTTGNYNIALGHSAMAGSLKGDGNIALGYTALQLADSANDNIAIGTSALYKNDSSRNIAIGFQSLYHNNRHGNMAIGYQSGHLNGYKQTGNQQAIENTYLGFQSGFAPNTGSKNVAIGFRALMGYGYYNYDDVNNVAYKRNIAIGDSALVDSYGSDQVGIGFKTLANSANTSSHIAIGTEALQNTQATYPNTAIGYKSQDSNTVGQANTSLGSYALVNNKKGYNNTAIGNAAMYEAANPVNSEYLYDNTAVGNDALRLARYFGETAVGAGALRNDTAGRYNTAIGYLSMYNHLSGNSNTALGTSALRFDSIGSKNTAIGVNSMMWHKYGDNNVSMGFASLENDSTGFANTAVGNETMNKSKIGEYNSTLGWRSLRYAYNPFENVAIGVGALEYTDSSFANTAIGRGAMMGLGGSKNTAIGYQSSGLSAGVPTTGNYVTQTTTIGYQSGYKNAGDYNTFIGSRSGYGGSTDSVRGVENTGTGAFTMYLNSKGEKNSATGYAALFNNFDGSKNVALGDSALFSNVNGTSNTAIGFNANVIAPNLNNATAIGAQAMVSQANSLVLGSIAGLNGAAADTRVGVNISAPDSIFSVANKFSVGKSGTVQYDNTVPVMNYMFKSGSSNANRMLFAHSPAFPTYGLQYLDAVDKFSFLGNGNNVLSIDLVNQRVGIGMISPSYQLQLSTDGAAKLSTSTWTVTSDIRLKTVDGQYNRGLKDILKLNTISYHYKPGNARQLSSETQCYGFSAQEVQQVFPEAVKLEADGYLSLNIHPILVAYVNAFKEQQQEVEDLRQQLNNLQQAQNDKLEQLMKRISQLENAPTTK